MQMLAEKSNAYTFPLWNLVQLPSAKKRHGFASWLVDQVLLENLSLGCPK